MFLNRNFAKIEAGMGLEFISGGGITVSGLEVGKIQQDHQGE
jgi:hypothetical protein